MTKHSLSFSLLACAVLAGAAGVASAQPNVLTPDPENPQPQPQPVPQPGQPQPVPQPMPPQPQPVPMVMPHAAMEAPDDERPSGLSIGIGIGYEFPTSLETPNVASVRFRLASGLVIEPRVVGSSTSNGTNDGTTSTTTNTVTDLGVGALIRYPIARHSRFDLEIVGAANVDSTTTNPMGDNNDTTVTTFTLDWGLAVEYWFSRHWNVSMTATNPLISLQSTSMDTDPSTSTSTNSYGLVFAPTVQLMLHLYN
jgi:hypothetical protein